MTQRDSLTLGIKLIGVYFAVLGVTATVMVGTNIVVQAVIDARESASEYRSLTSGISFVEVLQPIAYLLCAWTLLKLTHWCLRIADPLKDEA